MFQLSSFYCMSPKALFSLVSKGSYFGLLEKPTLQTLNPLSAKEAPGQEAQPQRGRSAAVSEAARVAANSKSSRTGAG